VRRGAGYTRPRRWSRETHVAPFGWGTERANQPRSAAPAISCATDCVVCNAIGACARAYASPAGPRKRPIMARRHAPPQT
jgi:hypothetical protein